EAEWREQRVATGHAERHDRDSACANGGHVEAALVRDGVLRLPIGVSDRDGATIGWIGRARGECERNQERGAGERTRRGSTMARQSEHCAYGEGWSDSIRYQTNALDTTKLCAPARNFRDIRRGVPARLVHAPQPGERRQ